MDDHKIIMDSDNLFIRFCFYTALWAQIVFRYCCSRSFSRNIVYTGAAQRDVHLASLRTRDSAFVSVKDSSHRLDMSRLKYVSFEKKQMAALVLKLFTTGNNYCRWHRNEMLKLSLQSICAVLARSAWMTELLWKLDIAGNQWRNQRYVVSFWDGRQACMWEVSTT